MPTNPEDPPRKTNTTKSNATKMPKALSGYNFDGYRLGKPCPPTRKTPKKTNTTKPNATKMPTALSGNISMATV